MNRSIIRAVGAALVTLAALPSFAADTVTVPTWSEKNAPTEVVIPKNLTRVAVLDFAVLDTLDAWGLGDRVVALPKSSALPWLTQYRDDKKITNVGTPKEIDLEALMASAPEVIFISGRLTKKLPELRRIAPVIYQKTDREAGALKNTREKLEQLGRLFNREVEAKAAADAFEARAAKIREAAEGKTAVVGMVTSSHFNMLGQKAPGSLIGHEFGFKNVAAGANSNHGSESSFELLLKFNPDYVFVLDRDSAIARPGAKLAQDIMKNPITDKTTAAKEGRIIYLNSAWYLAEGGLHATDLMFKDIEKTLGITK